MGLVLMAKRKPGPKPSEGVGRTEAITIRTTPAYKSWVERLAQHDATLRRASANVSETNDRALVAYAREIGFKEAAPIR
jgi:hypothetical protein